MRYRTDKIPQMYSRLVWCRETFGEETEGITWQRQRGRICFQQKQDLLLFVLRWA